MTLREVYVCRSRILIRNHNEFVLNSIAVNVGRHGKKIPFRRVRDKLQEAPLSSNQKDWLDNRTKKTLEELKNRGKSGRRIKNKT